MIDIRGINKAELLVDLYNKAHQVEVDRLQPSILFTIDGAEDLLKQTTSFDELYGRVLNVDLSNDQEFDETLYDSYNGFGMAQSVVDKIRLAYEMVEKQGQVIERLAKDLREDYNKIAELFKRIYKKEDLDKADVIISLIDYFSNISEWVMAYNNISMKYDKVLYSRDYWKHGILIVIKDGMFGTTDRNGNEIIPCQYECVQMLYHSGESTADTISYIKSPWRRHSAMSHRLKDFMED